jgi:hypothetical protein
MSIFLYPFKILYCETCATVLSISYGIYVSHFLGLEIAACVAFTFIPPMLLKVNTLFCSTRMSRILGDTYYFSKPVI